MKRRKLYSKVGWRKYLDPTNNVRVKTFLAINGTVIFKQLIDCIKTALEENQTEIMILVHKNVQSVVVIEQPDFDEVLTHCLQYFRSQEQYELCSEVVKIKSKIKKLPKKNVPVQV